MENAGMTKGNPPEWDATLSDGTRGLVGRSLNIT